MRIQIIPVLFIHYIIYIIIIKSQEILWCEPDFYPLDSNIWSYTDFDERGFDSTCFVGSQCGRLELDSTGAEIYRIDGDGERKKDMVLTFKWFVDWNWGNDGYFNIQYICDESNTNWVELIRYTEAPNGWTDATLPLPGTCDYKRNIGIKFYGEGSSASDIYIHDVCLTGTQSALNLAGQQTIFCETDFSDISDWDTDGDLESTNSPSCPDNTIYDNCGRIDTGETNPQESGSMYRYADATGLHYITLSFTYKTSGDFENNDNIQAQFDCNGNWQDLGKIFNIIGRSTNSITYTLPYYCRNTANIGIKIIVNADNERAYFNDVCFKGYPWTSTLVPTLQPTISTSLSPTWTGSLTSIWCTTGYNDITNWNITSGTFEESTDTRCPNDSEPCIFTSTFGITSMHRMSSGVAFRGLSVGFKYHSRYSLAGSGEYIRLSWNCSNINVGSFNDIIVTSQFDDLDLNAIWRLPVGCENSEYIVITLSVSMRSSWRSVFISDICLTGWKQTTNEPTKLPTETPSISPSSNPTTQSPTAMPTLTPSNMPTVSPTILPSVSPSKVTLEPSVSPSKLNNVETLKPTHFPTVMPSETPSKSPSATPTLSPTMIPTISPSNAPTLGPSVMPSVSPSNSPTVTPTKMPTYTGQTYDPSNSPSNAPSTSPLVVPTLSPSISPTVSAISSDGPSSSFSATIKSNLIIIIVGTCLLCIICVLIIIFIIFWKKKQIQEKFIKHQSTDLKRVTSNSIVKPPNHGIVFESNAIQLTSMSGETPVGDFDDMNNNDIINEIIGETNITKGEENSTGLNKNDNEYLATIAEMEDNKSLKQKAALNANIENEDALFKHVLNNEIENNQLRNDDIFNEMAFDQMVRDNNLNNSDDDVMDGFETTGGNTIQ